MKQQFKTLIDKFDYSILLFILLMSQDRIVIKLAAIVFIFIIRFNFKFDLKQNRLPFFYLLIIAAEILKYIFMGNIYLGNWATLLVSSLYWGLCFLTLHQIKLSIEKNSIETSENVLKAISVINFIFCINQLIRIMLVTHSINPYSVEINAPDINYPDIIHPYGASSGDLIRGIFYNYHHNTIICQLFFIFFLFNRQYLFATLNFIIIALGCFNLVSLLTVLVCAALLFILRGKTIKLFILALLTFIIAFYAYVTPENVEHLLEKINHSVSFIHLNQTSIIKIFYLFLVVLACAVLLFLSKNKIIALLNSKKYSLHLISLLILSVIFYIIYSMSKKQEIYVTSDKEILVLNTSYNMEKVSGKKISYQQTLKFIGTNPIYMTFGGGAGAFSSKLADNFSGVYGGGSLINKYLPAPPLQTYYTYHGSLNKYLTTLNTGKHSVNNYPNSVYNQLLSEYGFLGLFLFAIFYVLFFIKRYKHLRYGLILLPFLLIYFNYGYYFETIDIVIFFEFLMFLDMKKNSLLQGE